MLIDTSVWIDYFNGHPSLQAERLAQALQDNETIALPGIIITEILLGMPDDQQAHKISGLLEAFEYIAEPTRNDYLEAAAIYRRCRSHGYTIRSTIDCLIAQLCLRDQRPLLCKDRDFQAIAHYFPLKLVD